MRVNPVEQPEPKRSKRSTSDNNLEFKDECVVLPTKVRDWLLHIGVDELKYAQTLYQVEHGQKKRYYRYTSDRKSASSNTPLSDTTLTDGKVNKDGCLEQESTHTDDVEEHIDRRFDNGGKISQCNQNSPKGVVSNDCSAFHVTKPDNIVSWLRDVELYECYSSIPEGTIGLDAASAAVVDALRLGELMHASSTRWILDMCCAPGGKLLGTVSALRNLNNGETKWKIIGLDTIKRRLDVCASFLKKESVPNTVSVHLQQCRGQDFVEFDGESMIGRFDRILIDAECTHEGSLRSVLRTLKYWGADSLESRFTLEHAENIIANQRELLIHAIKLLRPGGMIIYSTCSLHEEQNEILVANVVNQFADLKFRQLPTKYCEHCLPCSNRKDPWPAVSTELCLLKCSRESYLPDRSSNDHLCSNMDSPVCVRFDPLGPDTDGIFMVAITKL
ncbi:NOL1/NOP2/sun family protein [Babesia bovis T2Bo]|uniref:SAM-dependent MTase RsmB/NOP-type domain-containing protein n=1 Tax=Babesia bovis TaxID=5865 RepID=A7AVE8_BABBO|nr:NOL1/NOP2/sun family protein [Babesia bovis T2Bo]EDO05774.1 NOL1/NOP2/sun family protein [Babesia bovis T2Bo]|eukprot:XP_001609342.1 hypothetical protein [Babesia bovis T2Bo]